MIKHFCDICEKEVQRNYSSARYRVKMGNAEVEILVAINGVYNSGVICLKCLLEVVNSGCPFITKPKEKPE